MPAPLPPNLTGTLLPDCCSTTSLGSCHLLAQELLRSFTVTGSSADTGYYLTPLTMRCLQFTSEATSSSQSSSVTDLSLYVTPSLETLFDAFSKPDFPPETPFLFYFTMLCHSSRSVLAPPRPAVHGVVEAQAWSLTAPLVIMALPLSSSAALVFR